MMVADLQKAMREADQAVLAICAATAARPESRSTARRASKPTSSHQRHGFSEVDARRPTRSFHWTYLKPCCVRFMSVQPGVSKGAVAGGVRSGSRMRQVGNRTTVITSIAGRKPLARPSGSVEDQDRHAQMRPFKTGPSISCLQAAGSPSF